MVAPGNPIASVEKVANIQQTFFRDVNGSGAVLAKGDHWFTFGVNVDFAVTGDEAGEAVGFQTAGLLEGIIEKAGGKNVRSDISRNQGGFEIKFNWE